jgi:Myb-like DNA-binding domain
MRFSIRRHHGSVSQLSAFNISYQILILYETVESLGAIKHWNHIASKLSGRTNKDCRKRWTKVSTNVNKGPWSPEENDRLRDGVEQYGYWFVFLSMPIVVDI